MKVLLKTCVILVLGLLLGATTIALAGTPRQPLSYEQTRLQIAEAARQEWIDVEEIGRSVEGRPLLLVHLSHGSSVADWRVFFFAQQHGDEPAGREAVVELVKLVSDDPALLPEDVDLWIVPSVNPDGGEISTRQNANGADLNRDHLLLAQPETLALHQAVAKVQPDLVVDCHEFSRDSESYTKKGWVKWPLITMGTANHPFLPEEAFEVGLDWVEAARKPLADAGFAYERYLVGGVPPDQETRPSTLEANDGRNGLASRGSLGFIIESGMFEHVDDSNADLDQRVDAYLVLLCRFLEDRELRKKSLAAVRTIRTTDLPTRLPSNFFWGNAGNKISQMRVIQSVDGHALSVETGNLMQDRIVKSTIKTPKAFMVVAEQAQAFAELMDRHGILYERMETETKLEVEGGFLIRVEDEDEPIYERYAGRQIVEPTPARERVFKVGALRVPVDQPLAVRVLQLLEPNLLYGLYQYQEFQQTVAWDGALPVWRVMSDD